MTVARHRPTARLTNPVIAVVTWVSSALAGLGQIVMFSGKVFISLPVTLRHYRQQTFKTMNSMAWGRGSLIVDGGVVSLLAILGVAVGAVIAIEAYGALELLGFGALSGIIGSFANIREIAPILTGIGFAAQAGCRMTAEIGSMRISEEIDATEALGIRAIPFVVGTRLIGGMLCVLPAYMLGLVISFVTGALIIKTFHNESGGTYDHYFAQFITVSEVLASITKALVFCILVTLIHCYYGYFASGGPAGVGIASGRAIRASLVVIVVANFAFSVLIWGLSPEMVFTG
ncbi:ABC transporter permease [Gordonia terrae]|uniref:ABC transporter permease n=1 Tax=Gordonia terrae TaxID=2055 RepID=A0A2I1R1G8_9ACTN|nr:ABC transporter permease [Gordonia terrae]PKZ62947.1 ABC transporter permease [Gordonia terrae]